MDVGLVTLDTAKIKLFKSLLKYCDITTVYGAVEPVKSTMFDNDDVLFVVVERVRNISTEKIRDPAGIRTQDLLNKVSQTLLSLSHSDPWQRSGRQVT